MNRQGTAKYLQCTFSTIVSCCLDLAETEHVIELAQDQYYLLQHVALLQVVGLEVVVMGYQHFGQAIVEAPSIGCFASFGISYFYGQSTGFFAIFLTSYFVGLSRKVGSTEKDSNRFGFTIDYCKDLKIVDDLEAYLVLKPMVDIEK